jgi:hypothetical protein
MEDITILYYSANNGDEKFEKEIVKNIIQNKGDLPVVSVTQKSIDLGKNICVGIHDVCYANEFRQIQIGLKNIKTRYVLVAKSDFLYPPEYFNFRPDGKSDLYRYANVWVVFANRHNPRYHFKGVSDGAQLVDRKLWLEKITEALGDEEVWYKKEDKPPLQRFGTNYRYVWAGKPCITFKTIWNINRGTQLRSNSKPTRDIAYWGEINNLKKQMNLC